MSSNRLLYGVLGLGAAGGGYYLYTAGGSPKVASKMAEREDRPPYLVGVRNAHRTRSEDASRVSAKVKSDLPGSGKEAKKEGEVWAEKAGQKLDSAVRAPRSA